MLYEMIKIAINAKDTDGLADKIQSLHSAGKLTNEEQDELMRLLNNE